MKRIVIDAADLILGFDPDSETPRYQQIYNAVRAAILEGRIPPGTQLPATRAVARQLGVSRNTAMLAFDQLLSEGYLVGKAGSGTYVTETLPEQFLNAHTNRNRSPEQTPSRHLSKRGTATVATPLPSMAVEDRIIPFKSAGPSIDLFPLDIWSRLTAQHLRSLPARAFGYGDPAGYGPLREAVASYLRMTRAVQCDAGQVIITSGSQQGIDLAAHVLLDPGETVWVEDPGYLGARASLRRAGIVLAPLPVDSQGMCIDVGMETAPHARLACVTPSHQFPLGVTTSLARRMALLEWADTNGTWIIEDDYDSEYRYAGRPLASLQGLDPHDRVIYMGTFSKVLFPALRLGYLVVPSDLVDAFTAERAAADRHSPILEQAVTATFIEEGHFARHVRRMRMLYKERQEALMEAAGRELQGLLRVDPAETGMHLIGWLPEGVDDTLASRQAARHGAIAAPLSLYTLRHAAPPGLLLAYAALSVQQIQRGVGRLAEALGELI